MGVTHGSSTVSLTAFFPWLHLKERVRLGDVEFLPFDAVRKARNDSELQDIFNSLATILKGYVDLKGRPGDRCTVVTRPFRIPPWNLKQEEDWEDAQWATSLLSLAALSANKYFSTLGNYSNTSVFQLFWQRFTEPAHYVAFQIRRRDGFTTDGGYLHGEVKVSVPPQCTTLDVAIDDGLLAGLQLARSARSRTLILLGPALSFFNLANTDAREMSEEAEMILMGSAFEQLLQAKGAYDLSVKLGRLIEPFGSMRVKEARAVRPGIKLDSKHSSAQEQWFVHRKWVEEFYWLRNALVHGESLASRDWGWAQIEHLTMGAFVFPLAVKLLLVQEGHYSLTPDDKARCRVMDRLLATTKWNAKETVESLISTKWHRILNDAFYEACLE